MHQAVSTRKNQIHNDFIEKINRRFLAETWGSRTAHYRRSPRDFAYEILGSRWWSEQESVARLLARHRRVAVKSANGVGKTFLAADLAIWFLYTHQPSIVLTTAPTARQVRHVLWQEIRRKVSNARVKLPGTLLTSRLDAGPGWFAIGLATDNPVKFQGFHGDHILIIFDEASGIPDGIWQAAEAVAVSANNKILAIGNPLTTEGQFYRCFTRKGEWKVRTISAFEHPNITRASIKIPGCITTQFIESRIQDWCDTSPPSLAGRGAGGVGDTLNTQHLTPNTQHLTPEKTTPETFIWNGITYRPNNLFRARILGEFPDANDESLIPLRWIEAAVKRHGELPAEGFIRLAADIARFGDDDTIIGIRIGPVLTHLEAHHGIDTMAVAERINTLAYEQHPEAIAVDCIGIGAGVVDRLRQLGTEGVYEINGSQAANNSERFANRRAELYWGLREKFRDGDISFAPEDRLVEELAAIRYIITAQGKIQMESKDEMKRRLGGSPDRADMLAMLYDGPTESYREEIEAYHRQRRLNRDSNPWLSPTW